MRTAFSIPIATLLGVVASSGAPTDGDIVVITKSGIQTSQGKAPKNSDGTLFLRSAVETPARTSPSKPAPTPAKQSKKSAPKKSSTKNERAIKIEKKSSAPLEDDLDEYSHVATIPDPAEPVNRGTFWLNHQLYHYLLRPVSKAYEFVIPSPARTAIHNVFDNAEYPVRVVNHAPPTGIQTGRSGNTEISGELRGGVWEA
jgi:hypothetical protein